MIMTFFGSRLQQMPYPSPKEWSEKGIREFLQSRNSEDKHFECKAFLHFDWKLKCEADKINLHDLSARPFHTTNPSKSYLCLRVIESVLAFANAEGGLLFLGVAENSPNLPPIDAIHISSKFIVTGIERDGISLQNDILDEDKYKQQLQNLLFPSIDSKHEYIEKRIEKGKPSIRKRFIKYSRDYRKDLVEDIHVIPVYDEDGKVKNVAILLVKPAKMPIIIEEFIEGNPSTPIPKLYKRLAFNNNGPLVGGELIQYLQGHSSPCIYSQREHKDLVPKQFREALKDYVVPMMDGKSVVNSIAESLESRENIFVIGESGMGKSLLMANCYLKLKTNQQSCYYSIDRTQGPAIYESAPVLCNIRQQLEATAGMPRIEPPRRYESKAMWVWEKEYIEILIKSWSEANPGKNLLIFIDGMDENYNQNRETEFILNILESLVKEKELNASWVFSSQPRKGMRWVQDCFRMIHLDGLGKDEGKKLLDKVMSGKHLDLYEDIMRRARMENDLYDPEMLVMIANAINESKTVPFRSLASREAFLGKLPLDFREKYKWLFSRYTNASKLDEISSLSENSHRWEKLIPNIPYTKLITDILSILAVSRVPIPIDTLAWALEIEDRNPQTDFRGRMLQAFQSYPREVLETAGMLKTALDDLRRFIKIVEEADGEYSFCKEAVRDSFLAFIAKVSIESACARLFQLAMDELAAMNLHNLHQRPAYLLNEILFLLSYRRDDSSKGLEKLILSDFFPEWLQTRAEKGKAKRWSPDFMRDLILFDSTKLPSSLAERLMLIRSALIDWGQYLDAWPECTAALLRNSSDCRDIWPPKPETGRLLIPCDGYVRKIKGHYGVIHALVALPDGRLASGSEDGTIILWNLETDQCQVIITGESVGSLAILPDGRLVSSAWTSNTIVWDIETGERKRITYGLDSLSVLPDGRIIGTDIDGNIEICDVDKENVMRLESEESDFTSLGLISDNRLAIGYGSRGIWLWDLKTDQAQPLMTIEGERYVNSQLKLFSKVRIASDIKVGIIDPNAGYISTSVKYYNSQLQILSNDHIAYVASDSKLRIVDANTGYVSILSSKEDIDSILVLPDQQIIAGDSKGYVHFWNLVTGKHKKRRGHKKSVHNLVRLPDGCFASSSIDSTIIIWDPDKGKKKELEVPRSNFLFPYPMAVLPDGKIAGASKNFTIRVWDIESGQCKLLSGKNDGALSFIKLPGGRLATAHKNNLIRIWDLNGNICKILGDHSIEIFCMALLPDGNIISGGTDGNITVWNSYSGKHEILKPKGSSHIEDLKIIGNNQLISYEGHEGVIRLWDINRKISRRVNKARKLSMRFILPHFPEQKLVILDGVRLASKDGKNIRVWNIETGKTKILKGHLEKVSVLLALPDGGLASGSCDGSIIIWDNRLRKTSTLNGHEEDVLSLALSLDGCLLSGGKDGTIIIWDVKTGKSLSLKGRSGPIHFLSILADGRIATGSREQFTVRIWNTTGGKQVGANTIDLQQKINDETNSEEKIAFLEAPPTFLTYWESGNCLVVGTGAGLEFFRL